MKGSYNWSANASDNIENIVIIVNEEIAKSFSQKYLELIKNFSIHKV
jgi:phosphatidylserine/phosphatidylglycerophosphate/cardiolipin synthase-like enzyme